MKKQWADLPLAAAALSSSAPVSSSSAHPELPVVPLQKKGLLLQLEGVQVAQAGSSGKKHSQGRNRLVQK